MRASSSLQYALASRRRGRRPGGRRGPGAVPEYGAQGTIARARPVRCRERARRCTNPRDRPGGRAYWRRRIGRAGDAGLAQRSDSRAAGEGHAARAARPRAWRRARLHLGRLAVLVLVLIGASFYVSPLRAFFAQQDRYQHAADALAGGARRQRRLQPAGASCSPRRTYVAQVARADSMLVPPDTQVFVVKGLPGRDAEPVVRWRRRALGRVHLGARPPRRPLAHPAPLTRR